MRLYIALIVIGAMFLISSCQHQTHPLPALPVSTVSEHSFQLVWQQSFIKHQARTPLNLQPYIDGAYVYVAQPNGYIHCLNWKTGALRWQHRFTDNFSMPMTAVGHVLIAGTSFGEIIAINKANGEVLWRQWVGYQLQVVPFVEGERLFVKIASGVYALNLHTGMKLWYYQHDVPDMILYSMSVPIAYKDMILVGFADGQLVALNQATGDVRWTKRLAKDTLLDKERMCDIAATPVLQGERLYVATYQGFLAAIGLTRDIRYWTAEIKVHQDLLVDGNAIYVVDATSTLWCLNQQSGEVIWRQDGLRQRDVSKPVLLGHKLLVTDSQGHVYLLSKSTGMVLDWMVFDTLGMMADPFIVGQTVLLYGRSGLLAKYQIH